MTNKIKTLLQAVVDYSNVGENFRKECIDALNESKNAFTINIQFDQQRISDLLVSALEGGSNYWYRLENENDDTSKPYWERSFVEGIKISNACADDGETNRREALVNPESMQRGLSLLAERYPRHFADLLTGRDDAETADVWLQLVVFGEVIYG